MGTSTNYLGSPNWSAAKNATTRAGGEGNVTSQNAAAIVRAFVHQMLQESQLGFGLSSSSQSGNSSAPSRGNRTIGGGRSSTRARLKGGAVRTVAQNIGNFLADVETKGFREALAERGLINLTGKSPDEIVLALGDLLGGPGSLIEESALRVALMKLMLEWSEGTQDINELGESVTNVAQDIESALHAFIGHYIFEVFKTVGYQGVLAAHGFEKAESMVGQIRDFIDAKIARLEASHELSSVDWNGASGAAIVDGIVADTIEIFGGGESL